MGRAGAHGRLHHTTTGDSGQMHYPDVTFDAICTSPTYGNRMADHHEARDGSPRDTYRHVLGRPLTPGNSGALHWGDGIAGEEYRLRTCGGLDRMPPRAEAWRDLRVEREGPHLRRRPAARHQLACGHTADARASSARAACTCPVPASATAPTGICASTTRASCSSDETDDTPLPSASGLLHPTAWPTGTQPYIVNAGDNHKARAWAPHREVLSYAGTTP